ncbi:MAG TPA: large conductance mechanosensitive channel protein MscL [Thermoanaerobaculia bacterium]|nr:large conductance mechanosensitive channel protein MscL [Thermoanaerobaculia bacterium]
MWQDFKAFMSRGSVLDLAIGIMIGGAFAPIASSLVNDLIMPVVGLVFGNATFADRFVILKEGATAGPYATLAAAKAAGATTLNYGVFVNAVLTFFIIGIAAFVIARVASRLQKPAPAAAAPETKECPFCCSVIPRAAKRCPQCTSPLEA